MLTRNKDVLINDDYHNFNMTFALAKIITKIR